METKLTDWIPWGGNEEDSPPSALDPDDFVRVQLRRGINLDAAVEDLTWAVTGDGGDILYYCFNPYQDK